MKTVWKYQFKESVVTWVLPEFSTPILVGIAPDGVPSVWFEVDTDAPRKKTRAEIIGTGQPVPPSSNHMGSFVQGPFVWHVYLSRLPVE